MVTNRVGSEVEIFSCQITKNKSSLLIVSHLRIRDGSSNSGPGTERVTSKYAQKDAGRCRKEAEERGNRT